MRVRAFLLVFLVALAASLRAATPLTLNTSSREEVRQFYRAIYGASEGVTMNWTGNYTSGAAGDTSSLYKDATLLRINFFRALAGVPAAVTLNSTYNGKDQQAALMMSVNRALSHFPPTSWASYTAAGAEAAGNSNLAIGNAGPDAITGYMNDNGGNNTAAGHRRWLIYPQTREMGTGDVPGDAATLQAANATWVIDSQVNATRPSTRTTAVPYPPAGYVPYTLVWPRWSFSYPGANFSNATVTMTRNGQSISAVREPVSTGAGEPTLVWVYDSQDTDVGATHPRPTADVTYSVNITNVSGGASVPTSFTYNVIVFDPDATGTDFTPVTVSGSATPALGTPASYTAAKPSFAGTFDWRLVQLSTFAKTYNGTAGLDGITASTSAGYSAVVTGVTGASGAAYHLAHPVFTLQSLTLPETFLVGANASVNFASRLSWATATQIAHVQASTDDGVSWTDIYTQAGTGAQGENSFANRSPSLAAFSGRTIRVRFAYTVSDSGFPQTDTTVGWFLDNITLTGVQTTLPGAGINVSTGTSFSFTPATTNGVGLQARGVLFGAYPLEWGPLTQVSAPAAASFTTQPGNLTATAGSQATFTTAATNNATYQWQLNGTNIGGATNASYTVASVQPAATGIYTARGTTTAGTATSQGAILGVDSSIKLVGPGTEFPNIFHAGTGFTYDQILLEGAAASVKADPGQILRLSYVDLSDDIVQVEFSGAGTLSIVLDGVSGPALPAKYNQSTLYMKGHAGIVLTGADVTTNLSVFSVGRANAVNQALFKDTVTYDGFADIAFVAITSTDGKFGGLRTANASYFATKGLTGVYAPGVEFTGPVFVGEIRAADDATPVYIIGSGADTRINGGELLQTNGRAVQISGVSQLKFDPGSDSHGNLYAAQRNHARLEQNGADVTSTVTVNPQ